ncbi:hypothetical protein D3C78_1844460 [compost metagenome]
MRRVGVHADKNVGFVDNPDQPLPTLKHRQLRDIGQTHALEGGEQGVARPDADHPAVFETPGDKVA